MKRILSLLAILIIFSFSLFAADEVTLEGDVSLLNNKEPIKKTEKIFVDEYYSMNLILGGTTSPIFENDRSLVSGIEINFYKYYGRKNYGTSLKFSFLGEDKTYGSYKVTPGLVYRINASDQIELFTGVGPSFTYYNKMLNSTDPLNLFYIGVEGEMGMRFYPIKDTHKLALAAGFDGGYMWNVPVGDSVGLEERYQVCAFFGFSYIFRTR